MIFQYDPSGFLSSYLMLSIILPFTMVFIYYSRQSIISLDCTCRICLRREQKKNEISSHFVAKKLGCLAPSLQSSVPTQIITILRKPFTTKSFKNKKYIFILLIFCFVLLRNVLTLSLKSSGSFNPYEILDVDETADLKTIKRAYRRKIRQFDSDLFDDEDKKKVDDISVLINKAYQILSNEEGFSENDDKVSFYSLPSVLRNHGNVFLALYILVLAVYVPFFAYKRWHMSQMYNKLGVSYATMEIFYNKLSVDIENTQIMLIRSLIGILSEADEYKIFSKKYSVPEEFKNNIEMNFGMPLKDSDKITVPYAMLIDHLFRTEYFNDPEFLKLTMKLINGMKMVAVARSAFNIFEKILILEKMVVQAVFDPNYFLLQLPHFTFEDLLMKNWELNDAQKEEHRRIQNFIPKVEVLKAEILGYSAVEEKSADVTSGNKIQPLIAPLEAEFILKITLKRIETNESLSKSKIFTIGDGPSDIGFALKGEIDDNALINSFGTYRNTLVHCLLPFDKYLEWNVAVKVGNKIYFNQISDFKGVKDLFYTLYLTECMNVQVFVVSNGYFGNDESQSFSVVVK